MGADYQVSNKPPFLMAPAILDQAAPNQNQWYDIMTEEENIRIIHIIMQVGTANETLECEVIADGVTYTMAALAAVAGTNYVVRLRTRARLADDEFEGAVDNAAFSHAFLLEGRHAVTVRLRKTTALGAGTLYGKVLYNQY